MCRQNKNTSPFYKGRVRGISTGSPRGAKPLSITTSPSPSKERGTKGVM